MSPWLTFAVGIIIGLLVGWVIDVVYRRRTDPARDVEPVEAGLAPPAWTTPLPGAPTEREAPAASEMESPVEPERPVDAEAAEELEEPARGSPSAID